MIFQQQPRLNGPQGSWKVRLGLILSLAGAIALVIAVAVLALGLAIVLLPVIAVGLLIGSWQLRRLRRRAMAQGADAAWRQQRGATPVIDGDFTVIENDAVDERRRT